MRTHTLSPAILAAALQGLEAQRERIDTQIADVRRLLRDGAKPIIADVRPRRKMSGSARRRIAAAQKKRWAAFYERSGQPGATGRKTAGRATVKGAAPGAPGRKRKMSAAGRKRIIAATKKRWAAFHKAQRLAAKSAAPKK